MFVLGLGDGGGGIGIGSVEGVISKFLFDKWCRSEGRIVWVLGFLGF